VWNSTLVEDYGRVDSVIINSRARLELPPHLAAQQMQHDDETVVGVVAYPDGLGEFRAGILGHLWGTLTTPHFQDVGSLLAVFNQ
jgi:hypothetical protein